MKQNDTVLNPLRKWGSITPAEAWTDLRIYRLGARIFDLREKGHDIVNVQPLGKPAKYVLMAERKAA